MNDIQNEKQKFIEAAVISSKALALGDHKTANKKAKILHKILENIRTGVVDKNILVELLDNEHLGVSILAAIDLLRINYEVELAEITLERIVSMNQIGMEIEEKLRIHGAEYQLKNWKEKGYVT